MGMIAELLLLWNQFKDHICDDLLRELEQRSVNITSLQEPHLDYGLYLLSVGLTDISKTLTEFNLPLPHYRWSQLLPYVGRGFDPTVETALAEDLVSKLNQDQLSCFRIICTAIETEPQTAHFYLQGTGGTGKTFLYKALCHYFCAQGKSVLCVASTGIAALLLPNGCTSHTQFKIPINLTDKTSCSITRNSRVGWQLQEAGLIIWDEVPMQHKYCFKAVHRLLCYLRSTMEDVLFGGIPVLLGGDFAQILGTQSDIVHACLQCSFVWPRLRTLYLLVNMRVRGGLLDEEIITWIGRIPYDPQLYGPVEIPSYITQTKELDSMINAIYPNEVLRTRHHSQDVFTDSAILTVHNETVLELNALLFSRFPGNMSTLLSIDSADVNDRGDGVHYIPVEELQCYDGTRRLANYRTGRREVA